MSEFSNIVSECDTFDQIVSWCESGKIVVPLIQTEGEEFTLFGELKNLIDEHGSRAGAIYLLAKFFVDDKNPILAVGQALKIFADLLEKHPNMRPGKRTYENMLDWTCWSSSTRNIRSGEGLTDDDIEQWKIDIRELEPNERFSLVKFLMLEAVRSDMLGWGGSTTDAISIRVPAQMFFEALPKPIEKKKRVRKMRSLRKV